MSLRSQNLKTEHTTRVTVENECRRAKHEKRTQRSRYIRNSLRAQNVKIDEKTHEYKKYVPESKT
jgi:hypothetical protein